MDAVKYLIPLLCLLVSGCGQLLVEEPIGSDFSPNELKDFEGIWIVDEPGSGLSVVHIEKRNDKGLFKLGHVEWDNKARHYKLTESDLILKKGTKYGIMHLADDNEGEIPEGLYLITLFHIQEDGSIQYWGYEPEKIGKFLESNLLEFDKRRSHNDDEIAVICDNPEKIIRILESKFDQIFKTESVATARKLPKEE